MCLCRDMIECMFYFRVFHANFISFQHVEVNVMFEFNKLFTSFSTKLFTICLVLISTIWFTHDSMRIMLSLLNIYLTN